MYKKKYDNLTNVHVYIVLIEIVKIQGKIAYRTTRENVRRPVIFYEKLIFNVKFKIAPLFSTYPWDLAKLSSE